MQPGSNRRRPAWSTTWAAKGAPRPTTAKTPWRIASVSCDSEGFQSRVASSRCAPSASSRVKSGGSGRKAPSVWSGIGPSPTRALSEAGRASSRSTGLNSLMGGSPGRVGTVSRKSDADRNRHSSRDALTSAHPACSARSRAPTSVAAAPIAASLRQGSDRDRQLRPEGRPGARCSQGRPGSYHMSMLRSAEGRSSVGPRRSCVDGIELDLVANGLWLSATHCWRRSMAQFPVRSSMAWSRSSASM